MSEFQVKSKNQNPNKKFDLTFSHNDDKVSFTEHGDVKSHRLLWDKQLQVQFKIQRLKS